MSENSKIEWCHHTFSPWVGCTKVSAACDNCYAESWSKRSGSPELWQGERRRTSSSYWQQPAKWDRQAKKQGTRFRVFPSLCDPFDNQVPSRWRDDFWYWIEQTPNLDWLLLTKRPQNIAKMLPDPRTGVKPWGAGWRNVWLGTTAEDETEYRRRWPFLAAIPAVVRFISYEPALGHLGEAIHAHTTRPDWFICGGESGPNARPMHPRWARSLRDQCKAAGVPFHFKQWGSLHPVYANPPDQEGTDFMCRPDGSPVTVRGPKNYRLLDGVEHNEFPEGRT
jgi:protein gp37